MLPTFDCATAGRAVEKAICSDPDLSRLDRQIDDAYKAALAKLDRNGVARLREEQRNFSAKRNKSFGNPNYQLKRELEARLLALRGMTADARPGVIRAETYACTSWAAAHEYTMQSLTPKGGRINKNCPIRLPQGAKVDVVNEDDDGYAVVTHRGKTWWVDDERVR
jgi:uncharacterized protein